ncbi:hypothetical protein M427DRAFT_142340 [Gonapodya prolifera JEL478]|uniref:SRR1-like domain-containing protein n=1 Tax=Gonapodya prolifera (strain JEL478) TaxID=1344416 RepID=A0A139AWT1_GONPJ|nr:hypothetical protein M427DRAFT_142340 [Gonapodya prolifera JEL478]|eukprot:KXS21180.1 hypothetical protein M427DRAFT_142340 [Gonapodya prolifera JEL478]
MRLVVWGLGSLTSTIARWQLAFALHINRTFAPTLATAVDPVFTVDDTRILEHFGFTATSNTEQFLPDPTSPTIYFLPHCPHSLTELILRHYLMTPRLTVTTGPQNMPKTTGISEDASSTSRRTLYPFLLLANSVSSFLTMSTSSAALPYVAMRHVTGSPSAFEDSDVARPDRGHEDASGPWLKVESRRTGNKKRTTQTKRTVVEKLEASSELQPPPAVPSDTVLQSARLIEVPVSNQLVEAVGSGRALNNMSIMWLVD